MPLLRRRSRQKYRDPKWPKGAEWIVLVDPETGADDGPFRVADFAPWEDGSGTWVCQTPHGHPQFLRITRQEGDDVWSEDGSGKIWHYRMVAVPAADVSGAE